MRLGSLTRSYKAEEMSDAGRWGVALQGDSDAEIRMALSYVPYQGAFGEKEAAGAVGVVLYCGVVML